MSKPQSHAARGEGIGAPILRKEDKRLLTGRGRYVADIDVAGQLHCTLVRSPHAHARLVRLDTSHAAARPGVVAVLTGDDMAADGVKPMRPMWVLTSADGRPMAQPPRWALGRGIVRHVGEPIVAVVAQTLEQAVDAAEAVEIEYEPLPAATDSRAAMAQGAPQLHAEAPGNIVFRAERGDRAAVDAGMRAAAHVIRLDLTNNRLIGVALEPRAVLAEPDDGNGKLTLTCSTQAPHHIRRAVTEELGMPEAAMRLVAPDVGGGFGYKGKHYPEETIVPWAARRLGRPVKWVATRSESFLSDTQARDHHSLCELALGADGTFIALKVDTVANVGAYVSTFGASIPGVIYMGLLAGPYRTPAIHVSSTGVLTNTVPTDAYRGAGRPEACYLLERLADEAARKLGLDRAEIRRRNLIPPAAMPYKTPIGPVYDCGDFPKVLARALDTAGYEGFFQRRAASGGSGKLRGIGLACFVESSGVAPSRFAAALGARVGFFEAAAIRVEPDGSVQASLGTHNHGQGHATTFSQIIASKLGVPFHAIKIEEGDTDRVPYGTGTFGSRSIAVGGSALDKASEKIIAKARQIAAHMLETAVADIVFEGGQFTVAGTDRKVALAEVARMAYVPGVFPPGMELGLNESAVYDPPNFAWSNGAHTAEVEIDPETGEITVLRYCSVDDIGTVINPMIVEGQILGGVALGVGQSLIEHCVYDGASGQLMTGSLMDYAMPRADDMPPVTSVLDEDQPCTHNPLGAKGCGEAGSIGAPAAIVNAVYDALRPLGVTELEMPLTPARVWAAIQSAKR